jgi:addiction module HigA family antidote
MQMHNPPHPGDFIKEVYLEHMGIGCDACAQLLGISSPLMRDLLIGVQSITPELAAKLSHALGSSPESWLRMQQIYDAWQRKTTGAGDIAK